jgi:hypothetical protein
MTFQMVDGQKRLSSAQSKSLRRGHSDKQCSGETRPGRCREGINLAGGNSRLRKGVVDEARKDGQVVPRSHLGNDASVFRMDGCLGGDTMREHLAVPAQNGSRRFVAGRLDRKDNPAQEPFPAGLFFLV